MSRDTTNPRAKYERLRAAHLTAVRVALGAHVARVEWPRERQYRLLGSVASTARYRGG